MSVSIELPVGLVYHLLRAVEKRSPLEACGLVRAVRSGRDIRVTGIRLVPNAALNPVRDYRIPAQYARDAWQEWASDSSHVFGTVHSHPEQPATPSIHDWRTMRGMYGVHLIIGNDGVVTFVSDSDGVRVVQWRYVR